MAISRPLRAFALLIFFAALATGARAKDDAGRLYLPSDDPLADVDATLARAKLDHKLALIIMGANWCHDSRELASWLQQPEMSSIIAANYEVEFVSVGYLDTAMEVIRRFGQPVIYGTPTVLIVDPVSERVINFDTSPHWRNANSIGLGETVEYFSAMAEPGARGVTGEELSVELAALLADIDAWEREQSERLYEAFAILAPMLAQYEQGDAPDEFGAYWDSVAAMRAQITGDLAALREQARDQIAAGDNPIELYYPEYPPFPWEPNQ